MIFLNKFQGEALLFNAQVRLLLLSKKRVPAGDQAIFFQLFWMNQVLECLLKQAL